jgi:hypothetical protein
MYSKEKLEMALSKEKAQEWANELKSGKYTQGKGYLRQDDNYCCLGILYDISTHDKGKWTQVDPGDIFKTSVGDEVGVLPSFVASALDIRQDPRAVLTLEIMEKYKLKFNNKYFVGEIVKLSALNDSGFTFEEIADIILNCKII